MISDIVMDLLNWNRLLESLKWKQVGFEQTTSNGSVALASPLYDKPYPNETISTIGEQ